MSAALDVPLDSPDWGHAWEETFLQHRKDLHRQRAAGESRRVDLPGRQRRRPVHSLTDAEIEEVARREAEIDVQRAIHEWNLAQVEARRKRRRGEAF